MPDAAGDQKAELGLVREVVGGKSEKEARAPAKHLSRSQGTKRCVDMGRGEGRDLEATHSQGGKAGVTREPTPPVQASRRLTESSGGRSRERGGKVKKHSRRLGQKGARACRQRLEPDRNARPGTGRGGKTATQKKQSYILNSEAVESKARTVGSSRGHGPCLKGPREKNVSLNQSAANVRPQEFAANKQGCEYKEKNRRRGQAH